eukprot:TRINITY_DN8891_c0_g1_i1.p1 TRINITY_DN8891_c0_g1~~TRINITY_DN8891_c0_g1_i1.p1  ORF type:complete len:973 (+),score=276.56 TRINITY_DN8891_c0_g1_i1:255-2921(+)
MAAVHIILDLPHKRQDLFSDFMNKLFAYLIMSCDESNARIRHDAALALHEVELAFPGILIMQASLVTELASRETTPSTAAAYAVLASAIIPSGVKLSSNAPSRRARQNSSKGNTGTPIPPKVYYVVPASYLSYPLQFKVPRADTERQEISDLKAGMLQLCSLTGSLPLPAQVAVVGSLMMVSRPLAIEREALHGAISKVCRGLTSGRSTTPTDVLAIAMAVALRNAGGLPELLSDRGSTLLIQLGLHDPTHPVWKQWLLYKWRKDLCYHLASKSVPMSSPLRMGGVASYYSAMVLSEALQAGPAALMDLTHLAEVLGPMLLAVKRHQARSRYTKLVFVDVWCTWFMTAGYCGGKEQVLQMLVNLLLRHPDEFRLQVVEVYEELKRLSMLQGMKEEKQKDVPVGSYGYGSLGNGNNGSFREGSYGAGSLKFRTPLSEYSEVSVDADVMDAGSTYEWLLRELPLALMRTALQRKGAGLGPSLCFVDTLFKSESPAKHVACRLLVELLKQRFETADWREQLLSLNCIKSALLSTNADAFMLQALSQMVRFFRSPSVRAQASMLYNMHTRLETNSFDEPENPPDMPVPLPQCPNGHDTMQGNGTMGLLKCTQCSNDVDPFTCYHCGDCKYYICVACIKTNVKQDEHVATSDPCPAGLTLSRAGTVYVECMGEEDYLASKNMVLCVDLKLSFDEGDGELLAVEVHFEIEPVEGVVGSEGVEACYVLPLEVLSVACLTGGSCADLTLHMEQVEPVPVKLLPTIVYSVVQDGVWHEKAARLPPLTLNAEDVLRPCPVSDDSKGRIHSGLQNKIHEHEDRWHTSKASLLTAKGAHFLSSFAPYLVPGTDNEYLVALAGHRHILLSADTTEDSSTTVGIHTSHWPALPLVDEVINRS